jgi:hypothetical protein
MRGIHFFMFLVALPAIAALGHDAYLYYINQPKPFDMAALGFIWTNYEPDSYKWVVEQTQPLGYWPYINWILAQKAVFVGVAFAGFFYILIGILRLLGVGGEKEVKNFSGNRRVDEILSNKKQGGFKYKRK